MQPATRPGFLSLEDAVALINSDSRSDAKVDTKWLVSHIDWIEEAHNFRICSKIRMRIKGVTNNT